MSESGPLSCRLSHTVFLRGQSVKLQTDPNSGKIESAETSPPNSPPTIPPIELHNRLNKIQALTPPTKHTNVSACICKPICISRTTRRRQTRLFASKVRTVDVKSFNGSSLIHYFCQCQTTSKLPGAYKCFRNRLQRCVQWRCDRYFITIKQAELLMITLRPN